MTRMSRCGHSRIGTRTSLPIGPSGRLASRSSHTSTRRRRQLTKLSLSHSHTFFFFLSHTHRSVGVKKFPHFYKEKETMVVLQGIATVKSPKGKPITIKKGDLVHFPQDMTVDWDVKEHFMAHYMFHTNT
mmetsp:Transcript_46301/g.112725  ORF Transcript_46301/g.112725 Transcript_46301/m.112725 type:complete len:130 (-) Transcript_46301:14-403(-)